MTKTPVAMLPASNKPGQPLLQVPGQSEEVQELVDEAAEGLSPVSAALRQEVADRQSPPAIEDKVQDAADRLSVLNQALKKEVRERHVLEFRLAAVTERAKASRDAAFHDLLTGLPNRALFNDRLLQGLAQARRHDRHLAVMFIDLNDFKKINDIHGHGAGDDVLTTIATRLMASTRDDDTVSRQGGDEFLYLLTEVEGAQDLRLIAEKLVASIRLPCSVRVDGRMIDLRVGASIGIAVFPADGTTAPALVRRADKAMYRAKAGKADICLHSELAPRGRGVPAPGRPTTP